MARIAVGCEMNVSRVTLDGRLGIIASRHFFFFALCDCQLVIWCHLTNIQRHYFNAQLNMVLNNLKGADIKRMWGLPASTIQYRHSHPSMLLLHSQATISPGPRRSASICLWTPCVPLHLNPGTLLIGCYAINPDTG